jgi:hypothetical protein
MSVPVMAEHSDIKPPFAALFSYSFTRAPAICFPLTCLLDLTIAVVIYLRMTLTIRSLLRSTLASSHSKTFSTSYMDKTMTSPVKIDWSKVDRPEPVFQPFASRRSVVYGTKGMVSSSQPLATEAGLEILRKGGNAGSIRPMTYALHIIC